MARNESLPTSIHVLPPRSTVNCRLCSVQFRASFRATFSDALNLSQLLGIQFKLPRQNLGRRVGREYALCRDVLELESDFGGRGVLSVGEERKVGGHLTRQCSQRRCMYRSGIRNASAVGQQCQQSPVASVAWDFLARLSPPARASGCGSFLELGEESFDVAGRKRNALHILYSPENQISSLPSTHQ